LLKALQARLGNHHQSSLFQVRFTTNPQVSK